MTTAKKAYFRGSPVVANDYRPATTFFIFIIFNKSKFSIDLRTKMW